MVSAAQGSIVIKSEQEHFDMRIALANIYIELFGVKNEKLLKMIRNVI